MVKAQVRGQLPDKESKSDSKEREAVQSDQFTKSPKLEKPSS